MDSRGIQLLLPARAENVALVRHALAGAAESLGMSEEAVADLKTVATEACMNVVLHAYEQEGGPLEVRAWPEGDDLVVVVRDFGGGIRPRPSADRDSLRLGLSLIAAMASDYEISGGHGRGTTIKLRLAINQAEPIAPTVPVLESDREEVRLTAWDSKALAPILARVLSVLAARRDFSIDELSDAMLFSDAISADLAASVRGEVARLVLSEDSEQGRLVLRIGPLMPGGATSLRERLFLPEELGGSLEALADEVRVEQDGDGEFLLASFGS